MLTKEELEGFAKNIPEENTKPKWLRLFALGNIPLVCFHDIYLFC